MNRLMITLAALMLLAVPGWTAAQEKCLTCHEGIEKIADGHRPSCRSASRRPACPRSAARGSRSIAAPIWVWSGQGCRREAARRR